MSHARRQDYNVCPDCGKGCVACFNAGKSHVDAERDRSREALRGLLEALDGPHTKDSETELEIAIGEARGAVGGDPE